MRPPEAPIKRFLRKILKTDTCWIWCGGKDGDGYGWFAADGHKKAHRWSYAHHKSPIPPGVGVLHSCDNPSCVNPKHLFLGPSAANNADRHAKGRTAIGERSGKTSLTTDNVLELRRMYSKGIPLKDIAVKIGVSLTSVSLIATGRTWKHVSGICQSRELIRGVSSS